MLVTTEQLQKFSGVYPENDSLTEIYINSAHDMIESYIGEDPEDDPRWPEHLAIVEVGSLVEDGEPSAGDTESGSESANEESTEPLPNPEFNSRFKGSIQMVCLEIASLLQQEESGNIGINGKSFGDSGSRTFLNITNFLPYLKKLDKYRTADALKL